jgi:hypothetical protein
MPKSRCLQHPRRKVTHLVHLGAPGAEDRLVCAECAQKIMQSRAEGVHPQAQVQTITLTALPTPTLLQGSPGPRRMLIHIADERIREVGHVTRCGAVLRDTTVVKDESFRVDYCSACGPLIDFEAATAAYARWLETLQHPTHPEQR